MGKLTKATTQKWFWIKKTTKKYCFLNECIKKFSIPNWESWHPVDYNSNNIF